MSFIPVVIPVLALVSWLVVAEDVSFVNEKGTLLDTAREEGETIFLKLAAQAGLAELLSKPGNLTLFGPTDEAFYDLPQRYRQALENDNQTRINFLKYHIINQTVYSSDFENEITFDTIYEEPVRINIYKNNTVITASGRPIDTGRVNLNATNGVLHVLDGVMIPPVGTMADTCSQNFQLKTLFTLLLESGLNEDVDTVGSLTLFGPTDEAFSHLPRGAIDNLLQNGTALKDILLYHLLPNTYYREGLTTGALKTLNGNSINLQATLDGIKLNGATVISTDQVVSNGVIHMIDTVLSPP